MEVLTPPAAYRVRIRHNVVVAIDGVTTAEAISIPDTKLEVTSQLAANNQANGCIDGDYYFADVKLARHFAKLSLDYLRRLIEKSEEAVEALVPEPDTIWRNPFFPNTDDV